MNLLELFRNEKDFITVAAGNVVFHVGEPPAGLMYVLIQGSADVLIGEMVVESAGPGALLGEMGLIDPAVRSATVMARSECRLAPIDVTRFHSLIQQTPEFATHVLKVVVDRLRRMDLMLVELLATIKKSTS